MRLQIGKFLVKNIDELDSIPANQDGLKKIIDLMYMGQIEYEGNAIPISRMFMEYYKKDYFFYPTQIFNKDGKQMYIFANSILVNEKKIILILYLILQIIILNIIFLYGNI